MDNIPTWDQLELPLLEAIQGRHDGRRLLEDEFLDDCLLDLFEMVMWRVCSRSDTKEASIGLAAQIIFNRFQKDKARIDQIAEAGKILLEASMWSVFTFEEIHKICTALVKPASYHEKIEKNTEADEMLRYCFEDNRKSGRRGMTTKRVRYYKIQRVSDDSDKIRRLNPETWFKYRNVPWREPTSEFEQVLPEKNRKFLYAIRSADLIKTVGKYWWDSRFERGKYKTPLGERIIREHGCFARYLMRTFENNDPEMPDHLARQSYTDQLLKLIMDRIYQRMVEHKVSSMSINWLCNEYPGFIDFDLVRAMYYGNDCKDWFDLNEEDQCIFIKKRNHNRWNDSSEEELDSDGESVSRRSTYPVHRSDLESRTYEIDWSGDNQNFSGIVNSETLNAAVEESKRDELIRKWIDYGSWGTGTNVRRTRYRDQEFPSEIITEEDEDPPATMEKENQNIPVQQNPIRSMGVPRSEVSPVLKEVVEDMSNVRIQSNLSVGSRASSRGRLRNRGSRFRGRSQVQPPRDVCSRDTTLKNTDDRSDFGESSIRQTSTAQLPEVVRNQPAPKTGSLSNYYNAPRSRATPRTQMNSESEVPERSEFGDSNVTPSGSIIQPNQFMEAGQNFSHGVHQLTYRQSMPQAQQNSFNNHSDFGSPSAQNPQQPTNPQNHSYPQETRQTGDSSFYNPGNRPLRGRRGRGSSIGPSTATTRGRGSSFATSSGGRGRGYARTQNSITAASLAFNSSLNRR